jgi:hypothetical protein
MSIARTDAGDEVAEPMGEDVSRPQEAADSSSRADTAIEPIPAAREECLE